MNEFTRAKEYFKRLKLLEKFVDGNTKVAKMILDGTIKDLIVIKGRFKSNEDDCFGLFTIYINKLHPGILKTSCIISNLPSLYRYKPLVDPFEFQYVIDKELANKSHNEEKTALFSNIIDRFVSEKAIKDLIYWIENNFIVEITNFFTNTIIDMSALEEPTVLIDFENVSSVEFLEKGEIDIHSAHYEQVKETETTEDTEETEEPVIENAVNTEDVGETKNIETTNDIKDADNTDKTKETKNTENILDIENTNDLKSVGNTKSKADLDSIENMVNSDDIKNEEDH